MAITINSLTPADPIIVAAGDVINFAVSASDSGGATLNYEGKFLTMLGLLILLAD